MLRRRNILPEIYGFLLLKIRCHSVTFEPKDLHTGELLITLMGRIQDFKGQVLKLLDIQFQILTPKSKSELFIGLGRKTPSFKFCYKLQKSKQTQINLKIPLIPRPQYLEFLLMEEKREHLISVQERSLFSYLLGLSKSVLSHSQRLQHICCLGSIFGLMSSKQHIFQTQKCQIMLVLW